MLAKLNLRLPKIPPELHAADEAVAAARATVEAAKASHRVAVDKLQRRQSALRPASTDELKQLRREMDAAFAEHDSCLAQLTIAQKAREPVLRGYEADARRALAFQVDAVVADIAKDLAGIDRKLADLAALDAATHERAITLDRKAPGSANRVAAIMEQYISSFVGQWKKETSQ